mmetsp:Transcript_67282/g.179427  ORF Transcript_67282/g.179427 Transcript_67282/m.179427 type:complete len:242 (+) Transcript_67282:2113-2838(+)
MLCSTRFQSGCRVVVLPAFVRTAVASSCTTVWVSPVPLGGLERSRRAALTGHGESRSNASTTVKATPPSGSLKISVSGSGASRADSGLGTMGYGSAPALSRSDTTCGLPASAASSTGDKPDASRTRGFAAARSKSSTSGTHPDMAAQCRGLRPPSSTACGLHLAARRSATSSVLSGHWPTGSSDPLIAQWSSSVLSVAADPSGILRFTTAPMPNQALRRRTLGGTGCPEPSRHRKEQSATR